MCPWQRVRVRVRVRLCVQVHVRARGLGRFSVRVLVRGRVVLSVFLAVSSFKAVFLLVSATVSMSVSRLLQCPCSCLLPPWPHPYSVHMPCLRDHVLRFSAIIILHRLQMTYCGP